MKLYKDKINYFDEQKFEIFICNVVISFINNKYIDKVKENPSVLNKFKLDIIIDDVMLVLTEDNKVPSKQMHDRKIKSFIKTSNHKYDNNNTYWLSSISKVKLLGDTQHYS